MGAMTWPVLEHPDFIKERETLPDEISDKLDAVIMLIETYGPLMKPRMSSRESVHGESPSWWTCRACPGGPSRHRARSTPRQPLIRFGCRHGRRSRDPNTPFRAATFQAAGIHLCSGAAPRRPPQVQTDHAAPRSPPPSRQTASARGGAVLRPPAGRRLEPDHSWRTAPRSRQRRSAVCGPRPRWPACGPAGCPPC